MTSPADGREIAVSGDPARARTTVVQALEARGFTFAWRDAWSGTAEKGSRAKQLWLGGFAPHLRVELSLLAVAGGTVVRLTRHSTGVSGGLMGRAKAIKQFNGVADEVITAFRSAGVLLGDPL